MMLISLYKSCCHEQYCQRVVVFRSSSTSSVDKGRTSSSGASFYSKWKQEEEREVEWADKY